MPRKTNKQLQEELLALTARNVWLVGVNRSIINLLGDTLSFFKTVKDNVTIVNQSLINAEHVLDKTLDDIKKAIRNEKSKRA